MKKLWYAVSRRGQGNIYTSRPVRNDSFGIWTGTIEGPFSCVVAQMEAEGEIYLPDRKWEDEPLELIINVTWEGQGNT